MLGFLLLTVFFMHSQTFSANNNFRVTASVAECRGSPLGLSISVQNASTSDIVIPEAHLPWGDESVLLLVAIDRDRKKLEDAIPVDDPVSTVVRVRPGETVSGCVQLQRRFRGLDRALEVGDVHLFWSYRIGSVTGDEPIYGGVLLRRRHLK